MEGWSKFKVPKIMKNFEKWLLNKYTLCKSLMGRENVSKRMRVALPMVYLSHSSYGMPGLAPLMNVLFWERRDFHVSFSGKDMSGNVWNRPSGSSMVDMGISSNIMKSPSPKCYMTFWDMVIYSDTLHWSDISPNRDLITELDLITVFDAITLFREVSIGHLQRMRLANRGCLHLRPRGPVQYGTCICSNVETILSWTCHIYGSFEFQTSLGTPILLNLQNGPYAHFGYWILISDPWPNLKVPKGAEA